jgi:signal transduction histidine kinase
MGVELDSACEAKQGGGNLVERTEMIVKAKREWERTFDAIREPLFLLDQFTIRRANVAAAELAQVDVRALIGHPCHEIFARRSELCPGCPLGVGADLGEVSIRGRDFSISFFPLDGGRVMHYRDVTEARRLEARLRESQKMASVGQLAAGAAHEINNPLGFLISNLNTLEEYIDDLRAAFARVRELQKLARSGQGDRALALLAAEDLLPQGARDALEEVPAILSESRAGGQRVHRIVRALKELAHESSSPRTAEDPWDILMRAVGRAGIAQDRVLIVSRARVKVLVEPIQIELALTNILMNALQATVEDTPIRIGVAHENAWALISVADQGCGMTPEVRARVFDPFFTTRGVGGGLGLGLTSAYGIITRHGGIIELESEPGCGTEARIKLPVITY